MNTSSSIAVNNYLRLLKGLSCENKINLVAGLIQDIASTPPPEAKHTNASVINRFFGAFQSDQSPEEMIGQIRGSRRFRGEGMLGEKDIPFT